VLEEWQLKLCPFCGSKAEVEYDDEPCYHGSSGWYFVRCTSCKSKGAKRDTEEDAAFAWNRRSDLVD